MFNKFVNYRVLPYYLANNGARSVIVVDNIKINFKCKLVAIYEHVKVILTYLSPYSLNINPIEILFVIFKL